MTQEDDSLTSFPLAQSWGASFPSKHSRISGGQQRRMKCEARMTDSRIGSSTEGLGSWLVTEEPMLGDQGVTEGQGLGLGSHAGAAAAQGRASC